MGIDQDDAVIANPIGAGFAPRRPSRAARATGKSGFDATPSRAARIGAVTRPLVEPTPNLSRRERRPNVFIARYTWRTAFLGVSLLVFSIKLASFYIGMGPGAAKFASYTTSRDAASIGMTGGDAWLFLVAAAICFTIGAGWLIQGIRRSVALRLDATSVSGFALLGQKRMIWSDLDRIEISWNRYYKRTLTFHGRMGASSVGYAITGIVVPVSRLDCSLSEVLAAVNTLAPEIKVVGSGKRPWLAELLEGLGEAWTRKLFR